VALRSAQDGSGEGVEVHKVDLELFAGGVRRVSDR